VTRAPIRWDLFCRVVDNLGDAAVMWRLARQLSVEHGRRVRLHIDQLAVLQRLLPQASHATPVDGVQLLELLDDPPAAPGRMPAAPDALDTDVIVSGFHAALPPAWRQRMKPGNPLWINLEYLSAEGWIERFHGLPSPHPDGVVEHYFYPGFVAGSGGLLCERDLFARRDRFAADRDAAARFLAELGVQRRPGETLASLLCYPEAPLPELAQQLAGSSATLHLLLPDGVAIGSGGAATDAAAALCAAAAGRLRISRIPFLPQRDYDRLLWSCDCNFVRGEDSLVRGLWSGRPFVWQIYRQADDAHLPKLQAFLGRLPDGLPASATRWWNQVPGATADGLMELIHHAPAGGAWLPQELLERLAMPDLASRLLAFAAGLQYPADDGRKWPGQL
jgi:uncharacterized repeat protein (TIGR03837 family)